ncbi:tyrosine aminotransferase-like [Planoprotostelium fungivorum]|uniref:Tyrosine aminotransferase n=1 Tax=Planoprotostelium fungivorum TaxID=1890364 RepID=A0A2P6NPI7_9EUKA|nr:tyrosine aminotransferase-like [Planoprotostelium fungivorum]
MEHEQHTMSALSNFRSNLTLQFSLITNLENSIYKVKLALLSPSFPLCGTHNRSAHTTDNSIMPLKTSTSTMLDSETVPAVRPRKIRAAKAAMRITNPLRDIVDQLKVPANPPKPLISLSIGDPTVFGNLPTADNIIERLVENAQTGKYNGYCHSTGYEAARAAVARTHSTSRSPLTPSDIFLTSGCSGALEIAISAVADEGSNLLIPAPGFTLYAVVCDYKNVEKRFYQCKAENNWEADLEHMESLIDDKTAAILVNNPGNPTGAVYSEKHLRDILALAERYGLPIIADEIYEGIIFKGHSFHALGDLSDNVPILTVGGLAKNYLLPGWRLGWVIAHDRHDVLSEVKIGLLKLTQVILGACTLIQSVVEEALLNTPDTYSQQLTATLETHASFLNEKLEKIGGLQPVTPGGAMYLMFGIDLQRFGCKTDIDFSKKLLEEEMVLVLPGTLFQAPGFVRLVTCPPLDKLEEACERIKLFCERHDTKTK